MEEIEYSSSDIYVDNDPNVFVELSRKGVCCYLLDAPHNRYLDVGHKRIASLKELDVKGQYVG
jgi:hypothetical protein